jgi:TetR/AcrR family transcriptional regulator
VSEYILTNSARRQYVASDVRREQILDRASDLASEAGLARLTMRRISARVGFSEAAIYRHFPTKQSLLLGLMDRLEARLLEPIRTIAAESDVPPDVRLQRVVGHHLALVLEAHSLPIQLLAEASAGGDPVLLARMRDIMHGYLSVLTELIGQGVAARLLPEVDPAVVAMWLLGGPAAMAIQHRLGLDRRLERRVAGRLVPFMFQMLASSARCVEEEQAARQPGRRKRQSARRSS